MRYFKIYNNAMTLRERGRGRMAFPSLFGFGQTDPVLDAEPSAEAADAAEEPVATDAAAEAAQAAAGDGTGAAAALVPVSKIEFYPDGTTVQRGVAGNTLAVDWWKSLEKALGMPEGSVGGSATIIQKAEELRSGKKMWMWATIIGVPVVGLAAFYAGRAKGRRGL